MSSRSLLAILSPILLLVLGAASSIRAMPDTPSKSKPQAAAKSPAKAAEPGDETPAQRSRPSTTPSASVVPMLSNPFFIGQAYGYIDEGEKLGAE